LRDEHSRDRRDRLSKEAVELARRAGDPAAIAYALDGRLAAISAPDTLDECLALVRDLRDVAEQIGDQERVANALDHRRTSQLMAGDLRDAEAGVETEGALVYKLRQPAQLWQVYSARAMFALAAGRLTEAEELIPQALAFGKRVLPDMAIALYRLQSHALCDLLGRFEEIEPEIRDLVTDHTARPVFRCVLTQVTHGSDASQRRSKRSMTSRKTASRGCHSTKSGSTG
jgi:tetratricopeptide (TPR) repeat protein